MSRSKNKFWFSKLGIDIIIGILIAILITGGAFIISHNIMDDLFYKYFENSQFVRSQANKMMESFKQYVKENNINSTDKQMINYWVEENNITVLAIQDKEAKIFESRQQIFEDNYERDNYEKSKVQREDKYYYRSQNMVKFSDKQFMVIMINDYTEGCRKIAKWTLLFS